MNIKRTGLTLELLDDVPALGSKNINIQLINDDTYADFNKKLCTEYDNTYQEYVFIDNKAIIPAFNNTGIMALSVLMKKDEHMIMCKKLSLKIDYAPCIEED